MRKPHDPREILKIFGPFLRPFQGEIEEPILEIIKQRHTAGDDSSEEPIIFTPIPDTQSVFSPLAISSPQQVSSPQDSPRGGRSPRYSATFKQPARRRSPRDSFEEGGDVFFSPRGRSVSMLISPRTSPRHSMQIGSLDVSSVSRSNRTTSLKIKPKKNSDSALMLGERTSLTLNKLRGTPPQSSSPQAMTQPIYRSTGSLPLYQPQSRSLAGTPDKGSSPSEEEGPLMHTPRKQSSIAAKLEDAKYNIASTDDKRRVLTGRFKAGLRKFSDRFLRSGDQLNTPSTSPTMTRKEGKKEELEEWNEIIPGAHIYLGFQPTSRYGSPFLDGEYPNYTLNPKIFHQEEASPDAVLGCVFTIQLAKEMTGGFVNNVAGNRPIDHNIFGDLGIVNLWLIIVDDTGDVNNEIALYRLYQLMNHFLDGLPLYLHCKSGKGRSALMMVAFICFCFLYHHYLTKSKEPYENFMPGEAEQIKQKKWANMLRRLRVVIDAVNCPDIIRELESTEIPGTQLLSKLRDTVEEYIKIHRRIKMKSAQQLTCLSIVEALAGQVFGEENTANLASRSPDEAFIDDLIQTRVFKDLHVYMSTRNQTNRVESFQRFLYRMVFNTDTWYEEMQDAVCKKECVDGFLSHFAQATSGPEMFKLGNTVQRDQKYRYEMISQFRDAIELLSKKHPNSVYSERYVSAHSFVVEPALTFENFETPSPNGPTLLTKGNLAARLSSREIPQRRRFIGGSKRNSATYSDRFSGAFTSDSSQQSPRTDKESPRLEFGYTEASSSEDERAKQPVRRPYNLDTLPSSGEEEDAAESSSSEDVVSLKTQATGSGFDFRF